jgi:hypothetical protein
MKAAAVWGGERATSSQSWGGEGWWLSFRWLGRPSSERRLSISATTSQYVYGLARSEQQVYLLSCRIEKHETKSTEAA